MNSFPEERAAPSPHGADAAEAGAPQTPHPWPGSAPATGPSSVPPTWPRGQDPRQKSVALAVLLSAMPGLGHIYLGYYQLGFLHAGIFASLVSILSMGAGGLEPLFGISLGFFALYNFVDAGRRAALYNQALAAAGELPPIELPANRGSIVGGLLLVGVGVLFLMHTRFGYDPEWIEEWWPLGLIGLGVYLFLKDVQSRRAE
jgi:hypothetical protein